MASTNEHVGVPLDVKGTVGVELPFNVTLTYILAGGVSFIPALQYNLTNLKIGFSNSKDKAYALLCALPFFKLFTLMFLASAYSQFWNNYVALFLYGFGSWLTHVTGYLNLMSSAKSKYNPVFVDPFVFLALLYIDYN